MDSTHKYQNLFNKVHRYSYLYLTTSMNTAVYAAKFYAMAWGTS